MCLNGKAGSLFLLCQPALGVDSGHAAGPGSGHGLPICGIGNVTCGEYPFYGRLRTGPGQNNVADFI